MRVLVRMVWKDLLRQARSPLAMLVTLMFPIVFSLLLGLTFGTGDVEPPRVELLIEDQDGTTLSGFLAGAFDNERAREYFDARQVGDEGRAMIERGEASALLRIPVGFSDDLLEGRPVALDLVRNPAQSILPEIAEQTMTVLADALDSGSRVLREPLNRLAPLLRDPDDDPGATGVSELSVAFYDAVDRASPWVMPPVVTLSVVQLGAEGGEDGGDASGGSSSSSTFSVFLFVFPGISVWALFMIADHAMRDILTEFTAGTLRRQLCGPLPPWMLVAGKTLYTAVVALLAWVVLGAVAAFTLEGAVDILGVALMSVAVLLASTGFGAVVYGVSRTAGRGATLSSIVLLAMAFMGGAFIPLGSLPGALRAVAPVSPFYWSTTAFQALLSSGAGWREILPNAGILAGLGCGLLAAGSLLLGRTVRGGAA